MSPLEAPPPLAQCLAESGGVASKEPRAPHLADSGATSQEHPAPHLADGGTTSEERLALRPTDGGATSKDRPASRLAPGFAWARVGAGRLALRGRPKLTLVPHLRSLGCDRLVTLLSAREGALTIGRVAEESGLAWTWSPLDNGRAPTDQPHHQLARTARELADRLGEGESVLIHCAAGLHRTGMLAYAVLRSLGLSPEGARASIAEARRETAEAMREHHFAWGDELVDGGVVRASP